MINWTDAPSSDAPPPRRAAARVRLAIWSRLGPLPEIVAPVVRCVVAAALVLTLVVFAMPRTGSSDREAVAAVRAPTFARLAAAAPAQGPPPDAAAPPASSAAIVQPAEDFRSLWTMPQVQYGQSFAGPPSPPKDLCRDFAASGFAQARWRESQVFKGEWECASPLVAGGRDAGTAFLVLRGPDKGTARSLMLKLNPASAGERAALLERVRPLLADFLLTAGVALPAKALDRIAAGKPADFETAFGHVRVVAEYSRPDARAINVAVSPVLAPAAHAACAEDCFAKTRSVRPKPAAGQDVVLH